ncbi:MAG: undecaprenyl-diphosphate phosphatase [Candidatus Omnitrophica bacterium]|nr:undecaprenyl-diphosphate phosphatase [Candidatus Omnitrophota bacterium]MDD5430596.1 undecaprenyl-diphosphate phosphatase [Candidatus Omnitrophota bacterium]
MKVVILGIVQGLTEFLPISSSGHLYFLERFFFVGDKYLSFVLFLHLATLLAIIIFFWKNIALLFKPQLFIYIAVITFISGIMGLGIKFYFENSFGNKYLLSFCFLINAGILLRLKTDSRQKVWEDFSLKDALFIGIMQGFSPFPGISRSGITIAALLSRGFSKAQAFMLSFLMAIPLLLGAFILEARDLTISGLSFENMASGFIFAFFSGLLAIFIVKKTLMVDKFKIFGYYCLLISLLSLIL